MIDPDDWKGWVWPVPITDGRIPAISQGFVPGVRAAQTNAQTPSHLGVDVMFPKRDGDPVGVQPPLMSRMFIAPAGTLVIAAGPGTIWAVGEGIYGKHVQIDHGQVGSAGGVNTFYQHLADYSRDWAHGDLIEAGEVLGVMGGDPSDNDPAHLHHLHFEFWLPRRGVPAAQWPTDPAPYMRWWSKIGIAAAIG